MHRVVLERRRQGENLLPVIAGRGNHLFDGQTPLGEGSGLVKDKGGGVGDPFKHKGTGDQKAPLAQCGCGRGQGRRGGDRKSTRLNSSHVKISYAVFCLKKKKNTTLLFNRISYSQ